MSAGRVVTANLPEDLVSKLDRIAKRIERSKSWIIKEALQEWVAKEERRDALTRQALKDIDEGRTIPHDEFVAAAERLKREQRIASGSSVSDDA